jgi:hypothetical protein
MAKQQSNPKKIITQQVRLSYVHLTTPRTPPAGGDPKFGATVLLPKSDIRTKQLIDSAIQAAIAEGVTSTWGGVRPPMPAVPVYDGDGVRPSGEPFGEECRGHWVMTASSKQRPEVVDANLQPILDATQIYSGMYARVSINFFAYNSNGKKGIGCGLGNVQKIADGEPLSGRASAAEDFDDSEFNAYYQSTVQPQAPYQQAPAPGYQQPYTPAPAYPAPAPVYPQQPMPYPPYQQAPAQPPMQQGYNTAAPAQQVDPISGRPAVGPIYGLNNR